MARSVPNPAKVPPLTASATKVILSDANSGVQCAYGALSHCWHANHGWHYKYHIDGLMSASSDTANHMLLAYPYDNETYGWKIYVVYSCNSKGSWLYVTDGSNDNYILLPNSGGALTTISGDCDFIHDGNHLSVSTSFDVFNADTTVYGIFFVQTVLATANSGENYDGVFALDSDDVGYDRPLTAYVYDGCVSMARDLYRISTFDVLVDADYGCVTGPVTWKVGSERVHTDAWTYFYYQPIVLFDRRTIQIYVFGTATGPIVVETDCGSYSIPTSATSGSFSSFINIFSGEPGQVRYIRVRMINPDTMVTRIVMLSYGIDMPDVTPTVALFESLDDGSGDEVVDEYGTEVEAEVS